MIYADKLSFYQNIPQFCSKICKNRPYIVKNTRQVCNCINIYLLPYLPHVSSSHPFGSQSIIIILMQLIGNCFHTQNSIRNIKTRIQFSEIYNQYRTEQKGPRENNQLCDSQISRTPQSNRQFQQASINCRYTNICYIYLEERCCNRCCFANLRSGECSFFQETVIL